MLVLVRAWRATGASLVRDIVVFNSVVLLARHWHPSCVLRVRPITKKLVTRMGDGCANPAQSFIQFRQNTNPPGFGPQPAIPFWFDCVSTESLPHNNPVVG